jgi:hypothetical protein
MMLNDSIREYLKEIKVSEVVDEKITELLVLYENIFPEPIQDIFIEFYLKTSEIYEYPSLQLFSKNFQYQIQNFMNSKTLEIYPLFSVDYINIDPENYKFKYAGENSKLVIDYSIAYVTQISLVAIGKNCDHLLKITNDYLKPRFKTNKYFKED